jgi:imidazolonepropionase-like amidohydrolase
MLKDPPIFTTLLSRASMRSITCPVSRPDRNDFANYANVALYRISEADAALAAQKHIVVVTTIGEAIDLTFDEKLDERSRLAVRAMLIDNLNVLRKHRVSIAIGSDSFRQTALAEALSLAKLKSLDNLTLLKMWCVATAATIFPKRKIGYLKDGYVANFLVLTANPLTDFNNVKTIELRIKQGEPLQP